MLELRVRGGSLDCGQPLVMGVVNATPDSFSDGAAMADRSAQFRRVDELIADGADIVDIGGQSAITGVHEVSLAEEIARITPVVERAVSSGATVSVDTYRSEVAHAALSLGAHIINDISGLRDQAMAEVIAAHKAGYVLMHNPGVPKQRLTETNLYTDVVTSVIEFWDNRLATLVAVGVPAEAVVLDFGPDIGKTPYQTLECLRRFDEFSQFARPMLLALSRKDFIGTILRCASRDRDDASLATIALTATKWGSVIARTHRPRAMKDAFTMMRYLNRSAELLPDERLRPELWRQSASSL